MNPLLTEARYALQRGWSIIPTNAGGRFDKKPHYVLVSTGNYTLSVQNRRVPSWKGFQDTHPTEEHLNMWFEDPTDKGMAVVTGTISGVVVLDFDGEDGIRLLKSLNLMPHVRTGSGGFHLYLKHPGWKVSTLAFKNKRTLAERYKGLDIRGDGGLAMLPPSCNKSGWYTWLRSPYDLDELTVLGDEMRDFLGLLTRPEAPSAAGRTFMENPGFHSEVTTQLLQWALERYVTDGRNNTGFLLSVKLRNRGYSLHDARAVMQSYVDHLPDVNLKGQRESYTYQEALSSLHQAYTRAPGA